MAWTKQRLEELLLGSALPAAAVDAAQGHASVTALRSCTGEVTATRLLRCTRLMQPPSAAPACIHACAPSTSIAVVTRKDCHRNMCLCLCACRRIRRCAKGTKCLQFLTWLSRSPGWAGGWRLTQRCVALQKNSPSHILVTCPYTCSAAQPVAVTRDADRRSSIGGEQVKGEVVISEFCSTNEPDEYDITVTVTGDDAGETALRAAVAGLKPAILERLQQYASELSSLPVQ